MIDKKLLNLERWLKSNSYNEAFSSLNKIIKIAGKLEKAIAANPEWEEKIRLIFSGIHSRYFVWAVEELVDGNATAEDIVTLIDRFDKIKNNLEKKDINKYYSYGLLKKVVDDYGETDKERRVREEALKHQESDTLHDSDNFLVVHPHSVISSQGWGRNTKWCISGEDSNLFDSYSRSNMLFYFIINKKLPGGKNVPLNKLALPTDGPHGFDYDEFRDATNEHIDSSKVTELLGEESDIIFKKILEHSEGKKFANVVEEESKDIVAKIEKKEELRKDEVIKILDLVKAREKTGFGGEYWMDIVLTHAPSHPNFMKLMFNVSSSYQEGLDNLKTELVPWEYAKLNTEESLNLYIIDYYDIGDSSKLNYFKSFFARDIDVLAPIFPMMYKHLIGFGKGRSAVYTFLSQGLSQDELKTLLSKLSNNMLLPLFESRRINVGTTEEAGRILLSRGIITKEEALDKVMDADNSIVLDDETNAEYWADRIENWE